MTDNFEPRLGDDGKPVNKELLNYRLKSIDDSLAEIKDSIKSNDNRYVLVAAFEEYKKDINKALEGKFDQTTGTNLRLLVYGAVAMILIGFFTVVVNSFIHTK